MIFVSLQNMEIWTIVHNTKKHIITTCPVWQRTRRTIFYDGEVLHFGELPPQEKPITLKYGSNINDIKVKMRAQHVNPSFYGYNSSKMKN